MTDQPLLFDDKYVDVDAERASQEAQARRREGEEAERRKAEGMKRAAAPKEHLLAIAREIAFDIQRGVLPHADGQKRADGLVTADDVFYQWQRVNRVRERQGHPAIPWIGNAAGQLFRGENWVA